jgi:NADPH:quinone reductase-like Zn-dependent oxidoreductase
MKAWEIREFGIDNLTLTERDKPVPGPDDVLVRLNAASLNYRDVMIASGTYNPRMKLPAVPFSDAGGEIVEVGEAVTKWESGDRICSVVIPAWIDGGPTAEKGKTAIGAGKFDGVLCEYAAFNEEAIVRAPQHLSYEESATLPCAAVTAWHRWSRPLEAGEMADIGKRRRIGLAVQFAKLWRTCYRTSSSDTKRRLNAGADDVQLSRHA